MTKYKYEYAVLNQYTPASNLDAAINEVAEKGFRLVQVIPNYKHWVELPEDGSRLSECILVIFEKPVE